MNRSALGWGISFATAAAWALAVGGEREAAACGGCFTPPPAQQTVSDITDERMLLSVSPEQTTLYDQIQYVGSPSSFAWVLPIRATVTVGLSADVLFDSMDELTATQITAPVVTCPGPPSNCTSGSGCGASASADSAGFAEANGGGTVTVTKAQNVGPYATVQLHASDSSALNAWLTENSFQIPAEVTPILDAYASEGFDFLAMKLLPGEGVQAMRPVRVSMPGASLSLPLRMASIGTGTTVGITIWVVSDGRYEPQNFPFFHIDDGALVWDFATSTSNYTTLRASNEAALAGRGWEIESSIDLNEQVIEGVITSGGIYNGPGVGTTSPSNAGDDYLPIPGADDADGGAGEDGGEDGGEGETADQVRNDDLTALFAGLSGPNVRVTRIRSDVSHAAMTTDLILQASADQSELSNVRTVTQTTGLQCPIYDNCAVTGYGTPAQAEASVSGHGGCGASRSGREPATPYLAFLSVGALVVVRAFRARRRVSEKA